MAEYRGLMFVGVMVSAIGIALSGASFGFGDKWWKMAISTACFFLFVAMLISCYI